MRTLRVGRLSNMRQKYRLRASHVDLLNESEGGEEAGVVTAF